jgi:phytoene synthase
MEAAGPRQHKLARAGDRGCSGGVSEGSLLEFVRRADPDRFFCALFAPPERRGALLALYAFNHELARAREAVREPMLALMRLQWWREVVEGARRRHEVAGPVGAALDDGALHAADLLAMVTAREVEAEAAIPGRAEWQAYVEGTAGMLAVAAGRALGAEAALLPRLADLGVAYGVAGQMRSVRALARQGRCLLPEDVLAAHGLSVHAAMAAPDAAELRPVLVELAHWGGQRLRRGAGRLPRGVLAAGLPGVLARRDLRRVGAAGGARGLGDRLAVVLAAAVGRV